jgi:hypothetical protein
VVVEVRVEGEEAGEVAPLRVNRARRLAGDLGHKVDAGERSKAPGGVLEARRDVMLQIIS